MTDTDDLVRLKGASIDLDTDDCVLWPMTINNAGYGLKYERRPGVGKRAYLAHRWMYELRVGPIPDKHVIDHLCRVKACVNPRHLEAVTLPENNARASAIRRANSEARESCVNGHVAEWFRKGSAGHLRCRSCERAKADARRSWKERIGPYPAI